MAHLTNNPSIQIPVVCVNLIRAYDRKNQTINRWGSILADNLTFFEAIDRRDIVSGRIKHPVACNSEKGAGRDLSTGEIACLMSHLKVLESRLADIGDRGLILMEDDLIPQSNAPEVFELIKEARIEAPLVDIILLCKPVHDFRTVSETTTLRVAGIPYPCGTTMVWMSPSGMRDYITRRSDFNAPADYWLEFCEERRLGVLRKPVAEHEGADTYVGNTHRGAKAQRLFRA